jgi:NADPH:quinone reductase-like Zn-dependent oxidoreductase
VKAVTFSRYGSPEVLRVEDIDRPEASEGEVLVRVYTTSVTRTDCGLRGAEYLVGRLFTGLVRPKRGRTGIELAGEVEAVGRGVTDLAVGDRVFGIGSGTNAEFVCVREAGAIARVPDSVSFQDAAAVADGGLSAMSPLRQDRLKNGDHVLVYGASGSIGVGAVQVGKHLGAHVTAVCKAESAELVRSLGADEVIDYRKDDFRANGERYDIVFDAVRRQSFLRCSRSVASDGTYITTDPGFLWHDALVSLDDVVEAHRYVDTHQKTGNVVLTVR